MKKWCGEMERVHVSVLAAALPHLQALEQPHPDLLVAPVADRQRGGGRTGEGSIRRCTTILNVSAVGLEERWSEVGGCTWPR